MTLRLLVFPVKDNRARSLVGELQFSFLFFSHKFPSRKNYAVRAQTRERNVLLCIYTYTAFSKEKPVEKMAFVYFRVASTHGRAGIWKLKFEIYSTESANIF